MTDAALRASEFACILTRRDEAIADCGLPPPRHHARRIRLVGRADVRWWDRNPVSMGPHLVAGSGAAACTMPMTDIPVAAFWTIALVGASAGTLSGAVGAGAATALAIVTRPNLVPLVAIVALVVGVAQRDRWPRLLAFGAISATGAIAVGLINLARVRIPAPLRIRRPGRSVLARVRVAQRPALRVLVPRDADRHPAAWTPITNHRTASRYRPPDRPHRARLPA